MGKSCDIAIIGAGPYGLSLAAHLSAAGADFRIFGRPLATWRAHMPRGMLLKSPGFASSLSAPDPDATLEAFCAAREIAYDDRSVPVPLSVFCDYASWFQKTYVPKLDVRQVDALSAAERGYTLTLDNGEQWDAARVVLAVGIGPFARMPAALAELSPQVASHSYDHRDLSSFAGRQLLVLGAGSSAVDTAVLASEAGAHVSLLARAPAIQYQPPPDPDPVSWLAAIANPSSGIGPGWRSVFCSNVPLLFRRLPRALRLSTARRHQKPGPGWFMRGRLEGRVLEYLGCQVQAVREQDGRVHVTVRGPDGQLLTLSADHIIAATGYRPDLRRLAFLDSGMRDGMAQTAHNPRLSDHFETSLPGLYVVGALAAHTFGPLMRFVIGADYAAPRLAAHLVRAAARRKVPREAAQAAASAV